MPLELQKLEELPRHTASQVKNKWGDVVRQVNRSGVAAVTSHSSVEMVLMPASDYEQLFFELASLRAQRQSSLDELTQRFNARLALLQQPDAAARVAALFDARGKLTQRPKAGVSF
jgi:prevent-host-death family protein